MNNNSIQEKSLLPENQHELHKFMAIVYRYKILNSSIHQLKQNSLKHKPQRVESKEPVKKPKKNTINKPYVTGIWSPEEQARYLLFTKTMREMGTQEARRKQRFYFNEMSRFIKTRNPSQCKSHDQKMLTRSFQPKFPKILCPKPHSKPVEKILDEPHFSSEPKIEIKIEDGSQLSKAIKHETGPSETIKLEFPSHENIKHEFIPPETVKEEFNPEETVKQEATEAFPQPQGFPFSQQIDILNHHDFRLSRQSPFFYHDFYGKTFLMAPQVFLQPEAMNHDLTREIHEMNTKIEEEF